MIDRLPAGHAGSDDLHRPSQVTDDGPLAVERIAQRIDDPADEGITDGNLEQLARGADLVPFGDIEIFAENNDANRILLEVEGHAAHLGADKLDHLAGHDAR